MRFIHILSNVIYGGGEQVLIHLCEEKSSTNNLYLLRHSKKIPKLKNIENNSIFAAKDNYKSLIDHFKTFSYLIFVLIKIKQRNRDKFSLVFHGFPCQYALIFARILFPRKKIYFIYHQVKRNHRGLFSIIRLLESLICFASNPYIGAPSLRSLNSVKNYLYKSLTKNLKFFEFRNCFLYINQNYNSYKKFEPIIKDKPFILTVARFDYLKGHKRLLDFIKKNKELYENYNFVLVGDGKYFSECEKFRSKNNLNNVKLLGFQDRKDLYSLYKEAKGVIIPSYRESFGISIIEALSFKKVVLVFEKSLLIDPNVKLIFLENRYTNNQINKLLFWDDKFSSSLIYSTDDTINSLNIF